jgi:hypothetical protein
MAEMRQAMGRNMAGDSEKSADARTKHGFAAVDGGAKVAGAGA